MKRRAPSGDSPETANLPRQGGQPLPAHVRASMESFFRANFSAIRVHRGTHAGRLGAIALTRGEDLHFAAGQFQPDTRRGRSVLGHELTHVLQQREGRVHATTRFGGLAANDDQQLEREANRLGQKAADAPPASGLADVSSQCLDRTHSPTLVQRLAVNDFRGGAAPPLDPVTLNGAQDLVRKSATGLMGVYFVRQNNDQIILKFLGMDDAYGSEAAELVIRQGTDLLTADSAMVAAGPPRQQINQDLQAWATDPRTQTDNRLRADVQNDTNVAQNPVVMVMETLPGESADEMATNAPNQLLAALQTPSVQKDLAEMLVIDALLQNSDRIERGIDAGTGARNASNIGNLFFSPTHRVHPIDNNAKLAAITARGHVDARVEMLDRLEGTNLRVAIDALFDAIRHACPPGLLANLNNDLNGAVGAQIRAGIATQIAIAKKNVSRTLRGFWIKRHLRKGFEELDSRYGNDPMVDRRDWTSFQMKRSYLKRMAKGVTQNLAKQEVWDKYP